MLATATLPPAGPGPTASNPDGGPRDQTLLYLASAYGLAGRLDEARHTLGLALRSPALNDISPRSQSARLFRFDDPARLDQKRRLVDGLRLAGLRDHLEEDADSMVPSDGALSAFEKMNSPTPTTVPGGVTIRTADLRNLLAERKPVVLTTAVGNPSLPGAVLVDQFSTGSFDDVWQARLERMMRELTGGDLGKPIVTFASNINRWQSRNLALRLIALGYKEVYWYRGGLEAWSAHDLPLAPVLLQLR